MHTQGLGFAWIRSLGLLAGLAGVAHGQVVTEFPIPTADSWPWGITAGPDGNLWFTEGNYTEGNGNKIGRITTAGIITEFPIPTANSGPRGIAAGPDGNLWFTEPYANQIGRITTAGVITEFALPAATGPYHIAAGPDGNLWYTGGNNKIGRITTAGVVTGEFPIPTPNGFPYEITAGPDGNLWFTEYNGNNIGRITTAGVVTEFPVPTFSSPTGITAGPDGNLWFTETYYYQIGRITPAGVITEFDLYFYGFGCSQGIAAGSDGNLWFTGLGNEIGRITTAGVVTAFPFVSDPGGVFPYAITAGPDGNLWFTEIYGNRIGRITTGPITPPTLSSIDPTSGTSVGGRVVTLSGGGFQTGASATFGGNAATGVVVTNETTISATTPALAAGTLNDVVVTNPDSGLALLPKAWLSDFLDVPQADIFHADVEKVFRNGITAGCGGGSYCRNNPVTRAQMAVFLLKAEHGSVYVPPACTGIFPDVECTPTPAFAVNWIEQLFNEAITGGCGGGNYCPGNSVTRAQMAVFLLKAEHGSSYLPPSCTGIFPDVECTPTPAFAVDWIEQLFNEGITGGCGAGNFCPGSSVTRGQMAVFLTKTFELP